MHDNEIQRVVDRWPHVAWCSNTDERNEAFGRADRANKPVIWIQTKRRYGKVTSDFIQVDGYRGLKKSVRDHEIDDLIHYYMGRTFNLAPSSHYNDIVGYIGQVTPGMDGLLIRDIPDFTERLATIMFDEDRWQPRESTRLRAEEPA